MIPSRPRRGRGHRPTPEYKARLVGAAHPTTPAGSYPAAFSLRSRLAPIMDQGSGAEGTETCFAHAQATLLVLAFSVAGTPLLWVPSPLGIARNTYSEEQPLATGELLQDTGANMGDVMTACMREGIRPIGALAPGRFSDVTPANVVMRPTLGDDELGARNLILGPTQVQPTASDFLPQLASTAANDLCGVSIGLHASPAFEAWFDSPPADLAPLTDTSGFTDDDGHDVALADYRTEADGTLSFWVRSSWGPGGDDGGVWVAGSWLVAGGCLEAWKIQLAALASAGGAT